MIDDYNPDGTGWARFSDDRTMRYHLARAVSDEARRDPDALRALADLATSASVGTSPYDVTTFLMCNPSDADAFRNDPTVGETVKFTRRWGGDITWVVNLWGFRSPYPSDLRKRAVGFRGDDAENDRAILLACSLATRVIIAWGNHGQLDHRATIVLRLLAQHGYDLHCLGTTQDGYPKHPLARGRHRIPADLQPIPWSAP